MRYMAGVSLAAVMGAPLRRAAPGFSVLELPLVAEAGLWGSRLQQFRRSRGLYAPEHRLRNWHTDLALVGMWDLPGPGIEPVSLTLAGRFFTTEPSGKPSLLLSNRAPFLAGPL